MERPIYCRAAPSRSIYSRGMAL